MSSEECNTILSKKQVLLKALLLLTIFSLGSITVSGTLLPLTISDARRTTGSFLLTVSPSTVSLPQGMNATSTVTILSIQGFHGTVSLTSQVTGGNLAVIFNPNRINVPAGGIATSKTTIQATKNTSINTYNIILTGTAMTGKRVLSSSTLLVANVNSQADFRVYAEPQTITVLAGFANSTSIVVESKNGFNGSVTLSATIPFGFLGVMGGQNPITLTPGASANTSLRVSTTMSTAPGKYNITIIGASGSVSHSCLLIISVVDPVPESLTLSGYYLLSPTGLTLSLRNNGNTPITLESYIVSDLSGDYWTLANWAGPTLPGATTGSAVIFIGASCDSCLYNGVPFAFQGFLAGHTYAITATTKLNTQFTFTVVVA